MAIYYRTRADWGANPALPRKGWKVPATQFKGLVGHHTVTEPDIDFDAPLQDRIGQADGHMRYIQTVRPDLGLDSPYSFVAIYIGGNDWVVCEGRGWYRTGAHTIGFNSSRYGVAYAGNSNDDTLPDFRPVLDHIGSHPECPTLTADFFDHQTVYETACWGNHLRTQQANGAFNPPYIQGEPIMADNPIGVFEELTDGHILKGWAYDPNRPADLVAIDVWSYDKNNSPVKRIAHGSTGETRTDIPRNLQNDSIGVRTGYMIPIQAGAHRVVVFAVNLPDTDGDNMNLPDLKGQLGPHSVISEGPPVSPDDGRAQLIEDGHVLTRKLDQVLDALA